MGIKVLPPDVNESAGQFTPVGDEIRFGLGAIRNVGASVVNAIVATRREKGAYTSFSDFLQKAELVVCNKRTIESLIKAGAFDSLGHSRRGLLAHHEGAVDTVVGVKREEANGQFDLFGTGDDEASSGTTIGLDFDFSPEEWPRKTLLAFEREMLGLYVSSHPLAGAERVLRKHGENSIASLMDDIADGTNVTIAGLISGLQRRVTKEGKPWASATVEDLDGGIEVLFFPKNYEAFGTVLADDIVVAVKGRINRRENSTSVIGMDLMIIDIDEVDVRSNPPVVVTISAEKITHKLLEDFRRIVTAHQGNTALRIKLRGRQESTLLAVNNYKVDPSTGFLSELKALLGAGCLE
jgi:DNA polymerase-3 subunit alpha